MFNLKKKNSAWKHQKEFDDLKNKLDELSGQLLFIDEAYSLNEGDDNEAQRLLPNLEKESIPKIDGGLGRIFV